MKSSKKTVFMLITGFVMLLFLPGKTYAQTYSPPRAVFPVPGHVIHHTYPTFSWIPMYPHKSTTTYELILVEVLAGQTAQAAIQANPLILRKAFIKTPVFTYPVSAPALKQGKVYAWQITAHYREGVNEVSVLRKLPGEVNVFRMANPQTATCITLWSEKPDDTRFYLVPDYELRFALGTRSHQEISQLQFAIVNQTGKSITQQRIVPVKVKNTEGQYTIPLRKYAAFRKKSTKHQIYTLKVSTPKGKNYEVNFTTK
ncbi:hypothetical protein [uncultured Microscilla sp.]|uniref:hypothetical protein n=1 Tax=uncultured Microscilla sp. TaxID=432653 RepID=UPI00262BAD4E|nr:hypothetical protein [uncultured Microscilla sp.]